MQMDNLAEKINEYSQPYTDQQLLVTKSVLLTGDDPEIKREEIRVLPRINGNDVGNMLRNLYAGGGQYSTQTQSDVWFESDGSRSTCRLSLRVMDSTRRRAAAAPRD